MKKEERKGKTLANIGKRWLRITDSIFKQRVHVLLNYTAKDYANWLKKLHAEDKDEGKNNDSFAGFSTAMAEKGKPDQYLIFVKHFSWTIKCQGTLVHEIVHTIVKIFDANNIPYNLDTQEFLAQEVSNMYEDIAHKLLK